jgi:hypothetical protein
LSCRSGQTATVVSAASIHSVIEGMDDMSIRG